jgi:hypothetical protein
MDIPPIIKVPIILPRGGGYGLTLPLKKGDEGLLIFCDTCFDLWWKNGQTNAPKASNADSPSGTQKQLEVRRHYLHDCGFCPGMWSQPNVLSNYSTTSMQLRSDDGTTIVDIAKTGVTVTSPKAVVHATGNVEVTAAEATVTTTGDVDVTASGNVNVAGSRVVLGPATTIDSRVFLDHTHSGVTTGGGVSGKVV